MADPAITSPSPGADLDGAIQLFVWDLGGIPIESSWLFVGSSNGGSQYASRSTGASNSASVGGLPTDGSTVFARVWYRTSGRWLSVDATYTAADSPSLPGFVEPPRQGALDGTSHSFRWTFNNYPIENSWVYAGSTVGGSDYTARQTGSDTEATVGPLPTDGSTVHARLYFKTGGSWYYVDEEFTAASVVVPDKDSLTKELQQLVGATDDGIVGPQTIAALNSNWLGRTDAFDASFAERFVNNGDLVEWVQNRINVRAGLDLAIDGDFGPTTETAVISHLSRGGVVAAESFLSLLDA